MQASVAWVAAEVHRTLNECPVWLQVPDTRPRLHLVWLGTSAVLTGTVRHQVGRSVTGTTWLVRPV